MNKTTLYRFLAHENNLSLTEAKRQLDQILSQIKQALMEGETLYLPQFGTFELRYHLPRQYRNPQTGALIEAAGFNQPSFRASATLKAAINNGHRFTEADTKITP